MIKATIERISHRLCLRVHFAIYYKDSPPGKSYNKWVDGLSEACWTYCCGYGVKFSLRQGNIYWGL